MNVLITTISQLSALQLPDVCYNSLLANDLQSYHYIMTLLVEAIDY